ncbi:hypothetical protein LCGC14_0812190 [marine sediment metagenome]|uniref:Uncharacterized protein n=1 Tax=marine sediment metagenome TaxID=412755 RepID=A0A0F9S6A1_9ZZZZ
MTNIKTPQWAVDLARGLNHDSGLFLTEPEVEEVARKFAEVDASTDPIREKVGELVEDILRAPIPSYWGIQDKARELRKLLEEK